ncbi:hypothetical protein HID58_011155 [Brassica napus]|uniref:DUF538 family protein n=1 Tax=Brassica napus TaxID=3708 RepID=A0ABQ8DXT8_BRANA|nr:hypothetical protein HID58_011155 [Brassica napus]
MDQILNKVGSYWLGQKANKQLDSVGDDINVRFVPHSTPFTLIMLTIFRFDIRFTDKHHSLSNSIQGRTKWLVNKIKGAVLSSFFFFCFHLTLKDESSTGKMQKPLPELLQEFGLPVGIFPRDATNYEFNEQTKKLTVFIPSICEVGYKDSSVLRFTTTVTGFLEKGKLADVEGMKTKVMIWVKVTSISVDSSKIHFNAGVKKSRRRDAYEVLRDGVEIDKF